MRQFNPLVLCAFLLMFVLGACNNSNAPLAIESVTFHRDDGSGGPGEEVKAFKPADRVFHAEIKLNKIEKDLKARLVWTAVDTAGGKNIEVGAADVAVGLANNISGKLELPQDWPVGAYKLDILLNGQPAKSVQFKVE